ncbi:hypothetical protein BJ138DRAFT_1163304 [Hygrophoropsis aurantiaca]|uniref:Uncharacterized protein n=1 Tax=Hygrophoropsis aurantiaca TaxID=72124 RepID=A0ACB7ZZ69_9AGAM|nr:hypothetical protein BJ138DRAFT_1163304 [Hygrophoropsis aurantiaca]
MADSAVLIQQLQTEQTMNYIIAAAGALVAYDQVLTFSREVNLVWNRQWSFMTALYLIARYSGDLLVIGTAAIYMDINWTYSGYVNMYLVVSWTSNVFLLIMQAILVIRVYALFNKSKKVLIFLATSYVFQATATFVIMGLVNNKRVVDGYYTSIGPTIGSVQELSNLNPSALSFLTILNQDITILSIVFDAILLLFALWAFVIHALEAKTLDGGWSVNALVRTLVTDHLLYFICYLVWQSLSLAVNDTEVGAILYNPDRFIRLLPARYHADESYLIHVAQFSHHIA